jgi:hypothetical protein
VTSVDTRGPVALPIAAAVAPARDFDFLNPARQRLAKALTRREGI